MRSGSVNELIQQIIINPTFKSQIKKCVQTIQKGEGELPTFAFQKAAKYPWQIEQGKLPIEGQKMIEDICELFSNMIDHNLHEILNREFVSISNQILIIRDQMTLFTQETNQKQQIMKQQLSEQMESLRKKIIIGQSIHKDKEFVRTRATGVLNASTSSSMRSDRKHEVHGQIEALKNEIRQMKKDLGGSELMNSLNEKIVYVQDRLQNELIGLKVKVEGIKQRSEKGFNQMIVKMKENSSKEYIGNEIKRSIKSHFKVYLQEVSALKQKQLFLEDHINKTGKGLEEYIGNQLKAVWVMISNFKRRQEELEEAVNINNQSFVLE